MIAFVLYHSMLFLCFYFQLQFIYKIIVSNKKKTCYFLYQFTATFLNCIINKFVYYLAEEKLYDIQIILLLSISLIKMELFSLLIISFSNNLKKSNKSKHPSLTKFNWNACSNLLLCIILSQFERDFFCLNSKFTLF